MLSINTYKPHPALKLCIRQYVSVAMTENTSFEEIIAVPIGLPGFSFPLKGTSVHILKNNPETYTLQFTTDTSSKGLNSVLIGQMTKHFTINYAPQSHNLFVLLNPLSAPFLGINMELLSNQIIPLDVMDIFPELPDTIEQLNQLSTLTLCIQVLEKMFLARISKVKKITSPSFEIGIQELLRYKGCASVVDCANKLKISKRTLERKFLTNIGLTPKQILRINRFREITKYLFLHPDADYFDAITLFNYYDQSHLIKDFVQFLGKSPEKFFSVEPEYSKEFIPKVW